MPQAFIDVDFEPFATKIFESTDFFSHWFLGIVRALIIILFF